MIHVVAEHIGPRLQFACNLIFKHILKSEYQLGTSSPAVSAESTIIRYSRNKSGEGCWIKPSGLLEERGVKDFEVESVAWDDLNGLFPSEGDIPFDLFAAAFYLATRYEEYLPFRGDQHGRFPAQSSILFQLDWLEEPVIDQWVQKLREEYFSEHDRSQDSRSYSYVSTIDIDSAFAYRYKGLMRSLGGFAKDISSGNWENMRDRFKSISGVNEDPFYTYDLLHEWHQEFSTDVIYFFLLADYGLNDKGVSYRSNHLQQLIRELADYHRIGIHPGYQSNKDVKQLESEVKRLEVISRREVERSRQHFLMLRFPETYRRLLSLGVKEDYTMGYAAQPGFRAGTSNPFPFYDLEEENERPLMIYPFAVMDATLNMYMEKRPEEAIQLIKELEAKVRSVKGSFMTLWHNESLSEKWGWQGWREVYRETLKLAEK